MGVTIGQDHKANVEWLSILAGLFFAVEGYFSSFLTSKMTNGKP